MEISKWLNVSEKDFLSKVTSLFLIEKTETSRRRNYLYQYTIGKEITPEFIKCLGEPIVLLRTEEKRINTYVESLYNWHLSLNKQQQEIFFYTSKTKRSPQRGFASRRDCLKDLKQFIFRRLELVEEIKQRTEQGHSPSE